jgi:hypothetical protein
MDAMTTSSKLSTQKQQSSRPKPQRSRCNDIAPTPKSRTQSPNNRTKPPQRSRCNDIPPKPKAQAQLPKKKSKTTRIISNDIAVSSNPKPLGHSASSNKFKTPKSLYQQDRERRKLRFHEYDEIQEIASVKDFSDKRKGRIWFTRAEMSIIRADCIDVVNMANEEHRLDDDVHELGGIYGLEKHTKALKIQMKEVTHRCIDTVLDIQHAKRKSEKKDFAAKMYFLQSAKATLDAHVYASELANEVKDYYK